MSIDNRHNYNLMHFFQYSILNSQYSILNTQYSILNTQYSILNTQYSILNTQYSILNTQYSILNTQYSIIQIFKIFKYIYTIVNDVSFSCLHVIPIIIFKT